MSITWHHIEALSGAGLSEQWQARVEGRSVAVIKRAQCESPHCDCSVNICERRDWTGLMIGPDGLLVDVEIVGTRVVLLAQAEVERGLASIGWEAR